MAKETMRDKIARLEKELEEKQQELNNCYDEITKLQNEQDEKFEKSPFCKKLTSENEILKESNKSLKNRLKLSKEIQDSQAKKLETLSSTTQIIHNARGAGRKKKQIEIESITEMLKSESAEAVAKKLGISRATLFRRLKESQN